MRILKFLIILLLVSGCKKDKIELSQIKKAQPIIEQKPSEDFDSFFKSFSSDKKFRMTRIKFPLEGFNSDENEHDSTNKSYEWEKDNWLFYSEEDFTDANEPDEIKTDKIKKEATIVYRIYKENSGYDIQYTFKKVDKKWNLIFYSYKNY